MEYLQCGISHNFSGFVPIVVALLLLEMKIDVSEPKYVIPAVITTIFQFVAYTFILIKSESISVAIFGNDKNGFLVYLFVLAGCYSFNFSKAQVNNFTKKLKQYEEKEESNKK